MSRIEEALKRAASSSNDMASVHRDRFAVAKIRVRIEDYATEQAAPAVAAPAIAPFVVDRSNKREGQSPAVPVSRFLAHVPESVEGKLISLQGTDRVSVEQYRRLATVVHGLQQQSGIKTLMVTSSVPREGKTLTCANLALTLSESYNRNVLLIDADMRRPFVHEIFGISNTTGLAEGLRAVAPPLRLVQVTPHLTILPAGQPTSDPMAGLASERMHGVLKEAAGRFDWVIVDTPPVGMISDANLMAGLVDGVIFVIGAGTTGYQLVDRALKEIGRERVIGTVLNRVGVEAAPAGGYYQQYYTAGTDRG